jgi:hypothetical protein
MPAHNVNTAALETVLNVAKSRIPFMEEELRSEEDDLLLGIGDQKLVQEISEEIFLLYASIYMLEDSLENADPNGNKV